MTTLIEKMIITAIVCLIGVIVFVGPSACTDRDGAIRTLEAAGYRNVEITGYRHFMKGEDDFYSTGFRAIGPNGHVVTGAVTSGLLKGNTIRTD